LLLLNPRTPIRYVPHSVKFTVAGQFSVEDPVTVSRKVAEAMLLAASVTTSVNLKVPVAVGVPEIVALGVPDTSGENPGGKDDELPTPHEYGCVPPDAVTFVL
jgi:hypothetical protein